MTQNHELDMDCVAEVKINQDTGCNDNYKQQLVNNNEAIIQPVIDDIIKKLLCLSKALFDSEKKYLQLQHIIELLIDLEKNLVNENAFIVLELIKSTKKMLLKIQSLELKIDNNNIKVINKCISSLPNLLKQHYDHKLQLDDEVLWCMEVADSITEGNDCFFAKIVYLDNFTSSILFGKEVDTPNSVKHNNNENGSLINKKNINQLEEASIGNNHFINEIDSNLAIGVNGETNFLTEASDLAKKLNELFIYGVKHNCLINYSADIINYLNLITLCFIANDVSVALLKINLSVL